MKFKKVIIVGVGLIGGSLARDFLAKKIAKEIVGFDANSKNLAEAQRLKIVTRVGHVIKNELQDADLVILAMPVGNIVSWIRENAEHVSEKTLVMDVGSTKKTILLAADRYFPEGHFVGCHPMAGSENSGARASLEGFFKNSSCMIVAGKKTKKIFVQKIKSLWQKLGAITFNMDAEKHDRHVALCSHLPHVLAFVLMSSLGGSSSLSQIRKMSGNSFRSLARISGSDATMWTDIFLHNNRFVSQVIKNFQKELSFFSKNVRLKSKNKLEPLILKANQTHRKVL